MSRNTIVLELPHKAALLRSVLLALLFPSSLLAQPPKLGVGGYKELKVDSVMPSQEVVLRGFHPGNFPKLFLPAPNEILLVHRNARKEQDSLLHIPKLKPLSLAAAFPVVKQRKLPGRIFQATPGLEAALLGTKYSSYLVTPRNGEWLGKFQGATDIEPEFTRCGRFLAFARAYPGDKQQGQPRFVFSAVIKDLRSQEQINIPQLPLQISAVSELNQGSIAVDVSRKCIFLFASVETPNGPTAKLTRIGFDSSLFHGFAFEVPVPSRSAGLLLDVERDRLLVVNDHRVDSVNPDTGESVRIWHSSQHRAIVFARDGSAMITSSHRGEYYVQAIDVASSPPIQLTLQHPHVDDHGNWRVAISSDSSEIAAVVPCNFRGKYPVICRWKNPVTRKDSGVRKK